MNYNFDQIRDRRNSDSIKWNFFDEDVLPLWVADMDFPSPPEVLSALKNRIDHGIFGYSKTQERTKKAVQNWLHNRHGWSIQTEEILLIPGVVQAFNVAAAAFSQPGDSIIIQTPAYHPFFDVSANAKLRQIISPLTTDSSGQYSLDKESFSKSIEPDTRIFILCNPHNPSGRVFTKDELLSIAEVCLENNVNICSDEIHSDIVHPGFQHIPIASLSPEIAQSSVTLVSTTKTFNLAGLKSSAAIIPNPRLRELFSNQLSGFVGSVGVLGEIGLAAAYECGSDWLTELLVYLEGNRRYVIDFVANELPGIKMFPPEGTYLAWLDCSELMMEDPAKFFLEEAKVGLNSGIWFGDEYSNHVRMNFGCPRETLTTGLDRIKTALLRL
jgi:cystathionine beta-lyase